LTTATDTLDHLVPEGTNVGLANPVEVIAKGHPPMAEGVILIDFDGTIIPFGQLFEHTPPLPGAIEAIQAFQQAGYKVVIFTSRLSPLWLQTVGQTPRQHIDFINDYLARYGVEVQGIVGH
jgi:histidinol phosphatase-like enzyme